MHIENSLIKLEQNFDRVLSQAEIKRSDVYEACHILGNPSLSSIEYAQVATILNYLNIDLEELIRGNICSHTVAAQLRGNPFYLRDRWIGNEGTRVRTFSSALSVLTKSDQDKILRKHQIRREFLEDESKFISAELLKSLFDCLGAYSFTKQLDIVGHVNCENFLKSAARDRAELLSFSDPKKAYVHFIENSTGKIEKNMDYRVLKIEQNSIVIEYKTKESVKDFFRVGHFGNIRFCQNIQGFLESLIKYKSDSIANVRKLSCAHLGDHSCTYKVSFDDIITH